MALIKCPECGKEQSSFAKICTYCSFPLEEYSMNPDDFTWKKEEQTSEENEDLVSDVDKVQSNEEDFADEIVSEEELSKNDIYECEDITDGDADCLNDSSAEYIETGDDLSSLDTIKEEKANLFIEMGLFHKIIDWLFAIILIFFAAALLAAGETIVGVMWVLAGFSLLPVRTILSLWAGILGEKKKWIRPVIILLFIFFSIFFA